MTALAGDRTANTSGVINLNTNTAFKCVPHILGYLQFLQSFVPMHITIVLTLTIPPGEADLPVCVRYDAYLHPEPPGPDLFTY